MILLDTHVLIWATQDTGQIGSKTSQIINTNWQNTTVAISAISFWECAMLQAKQRIALPISVMTWRKKLLSQGVIEIPIDGNVGVFAVTLDIHGDPADRMIVATAVQHNATLITADKKLLAMQNDNLHLQNALL